MFTVGFRRAEPTVVELSGSWKLHALNVCLSFVFLFVFVFFFPPAFLFSSPHQPSALTVVLVTGDSDRTKPAFLQFR